MNLSLKKEIINHIFNRFGIFNSIKEGPLSSKYLLDKKIGFEVENEKYQNNIWSGSADIEGSNIQFIIADLTEYIKEYCLLIQLEEHSPYAIRISLDPEDSGSLFFKIKNNNFADTSEEEAPVFNEKINGMWVEAPVLYQAKTLVAIESLMELFFTWEKNSNFNDIYADLIDFLKFDAEEDNE